MKITVKVTPDQLTAVVAQAWGCDISDVELDVEGITVETDLKGATRAEKIIDRAKAAQAAADSERAEG